MARGPPYGPGRHGLLKAELGPENTAVTAFQSCHPCSKNPADGKLITTQKDF